MRIRVVLSAAGAELTCDQSAPALPSVSWDPDMSSLSLSLGRAADGARIQVQLGPVESGELWRRIRAEYPPARPRPRQRGRIPG